MLEEGATTSRPRIAYEKQAISFKDLWAVRRTLLRSSIIGTLVGIVPAAGPNIAAFLGYSEARRASSHPQEFGTGILEGVAAPEAANNAVPAGALVPLLSFGIPGDTVTAILLGGLLLHGYTPGPMMIRENVELIYPMFLFLVLANLCMLAIGLWGVRPVARLVDLAGNRLLIGAVCMFGVIGGFAYSGQLTEALITVLFGILGYYLEKVGISIVPMSITVILGPMMEVYLRQSLIASGGDIWTLFFRPIAATLWLLAAVMAWSSIRVNRRIARVSAPPDGAACR
jgi:putative tricarboxylic transport membrane protein